MKTPPESEGRGFLIDARRKLHGRRPDPQDYRIARKALELIADA
jgi:hypothetical protein